MADPGCPWAYSAFPAISALRWRYGDQLQWRIATIGLTESPEQYEGRGYTPATMARTPLRFARLGMPYTLGPRARVVSTGRACRAIVAAREQSGQEHAYSVLRALSIGWFTTDRLLDEDDAILDVLTAAGIAEAETVVAALGDEAIEAAYQRDRAEARSAEGSPSSLQQRTAQTDGPERYTAPTLIFSRDGRTLEAGGHQPLAAYDVLLANMAPEADRRPPPESPAEALAEFPDGLVTREVSTLLAGHDQEPNDDAATAQLLDLEGAGRVSRQAVGTNAIWRLAR